MRIYKHISILFLVCFVCLGYNFAKDTKTRDELFEKANRFFETGDFNDAKEVYEEIVEEDPDFAPAYNAIGLIYSMDDKTLKKSIVKFLKAIKLDPYYADPFANLGIICYRIGKYERSRKYLERAMQLKPENPDYEFTMGWVLLSGLKDQGKAISYLEKSIELKPDYPAAIYILGMAYAEDGKRVEILELVTKLRILNREDLASALENLIRMPYDESKKEEEQKKILINYNVGNATLVKNSKEVVREAPHQEQYHAGAMRGRLGNIQLKLRVVGKDDVRLRVKGDGNVKLQGTIGVVGQ